MGKFNDLLIEIGVDTTSAKRSIKELDKLFDGMGKSFVGASKKASDSSEKSAKASAATSKVELKNIEKINNARIKQAVNQDKLSKKSAKSSASVFKAEFDRVDKLTNEYDKMFKEKDAKDKATYDKNKQRFIQKQQQRAKLRVERLKEAAKVDSDAQKSLKQRLAAYKKEKSASKAIHDAKLSQAKREQREQQKLNSLKDKRSQRADNYEGNFRRSAMFQKMNARQRGGFEGKIRQARTEFILTGNTNAFKNLTRDARAFQKQLSGLRVVQGGLQDSTRNMIRSYASLFALFEGTMAIKRVGKDFQGMEASMLAASGGRAAAAKDMQFLNGMVDEMGLNLKDTTDAWVKFKFAASGKIEQGEMEDIFTGLSMFGTALKVGNEEMKRSQKALIQIDEYCLAA